MTKLANSFILSNSIINNTERIKQNMNKQYFQEL